MPDVTLVVFESNDELLVELCVFGGQRSPERIFGELAHHARFGSLALGDDVEHADRVFEVEGLVIDVVQRAGRAKGIPLG